ncbi:MAG: nuclear transport factor 2 family protein [Methylocella sp.]
MAASEEVAACVYEFGWSGEIDGQPASGSGCGTTVLRRIEGTWRVAHEHLSRGRLWSE